MPDKRAVIILPNHISDVIIINYTRTLQFPMILHAEQSMFLSWVAEDFSTTGFLCLWRFERFALFPFPSENYKSR